MKINKETKIGLVVVVILAMFIWGLNYLKGKNMFSVSKQYYAVFSDIAGLQNSTAVSTNGLAVGYVSSIEFQNDDVNRIVVELSLKRDFSFPTNTVAEIYNTDLLGGKGVRLVIGDSKKIALDGDTLSTRLEPDILSLLKTTIIPIADRASASLLTLDSLLGDVRQTFNPQMRKDLQGVISETHTLIASERLRLSGILSNMQSFTQNLENNNGNINRITANLSALSDSLASSDIKPAITKMNQSLGQVQTLLTQINSGKGSLGKLAYNDSLYVTLNQTLSQLDSLLSDLEKNPGDYVHFSLFGRKTKVK